MKIENFNSPNQNDRAANKKHGQSPSLIILHYTGTRTMIEAHDIYMTADKVSPHYMIDKDGSIRAYVNEDKRAWHAGKSYWRGDTDINSSSIGIEIVNSGHEYNLEPFPEIQIQNLIELLRGIIARWQIPNKNILGHSDIAVGRKIDPGEHFPWDRLHAAGIGLLPEPVDITLPQPVETILTEIGYDPETPIEQRVTEFRRHYMRHSDLAAGVDEAVYHAVQSILQQSE